MLTGRAQDTGEDFVDVVAGCDRGDRIRILETAWNCTGDILDGVAFRLCREDGVGGEFWRCLAFVELQDLRLDPRRCLNDGGHVVGATLGAGVELIHVAAGIPEACLEDADAPAWDYSEAYARAVGPIRHLQLYGAAAEDADRGTARTAAEDGARCILGCLYGNWGDEAGFRAGPPAARTVRTLLTRIENMPKILLMTGHPIVADIDAGAPVPPRFVNALRERDTPYVYTVAARPLPPALLARGFQNVLRTAARYERTRHATLPGRAMYAGFVDAWDQAMFGGGSLTTATPADQPARSGGVVPGHPRPHALESAETHVPVPAD